MWKAVALIGIIISISDVFENGANPNCLANFLLLMNSLGSGCGPVDIAVASETREPGFESSHRQLFLNC